MSMFLTTQHPSLLSNPFRDDLTVQQLYAISKSVFGDQITNQLDIGDGILNLCSENRTTFEEALSLIEDISNIEVKAKAQKVLQDGLLRLEAYGNKYKRTDEHLPPAPSEILPLQDPHLSPALLEIPPPQPNSNWNMLKIFCLLMAMRMYHGQKFLHKANQMAILAHT